MNKKSIQGKEVGPLQFINRAHKLQCIIAELKEVLQFYADEKNYIGNCYCLDPELRFDKGKRARDILKKYNLSWNDLYDKLDKEIDKL